MRQRKVERLLGVAMPSLMAPSDRQPAYAPSLSAAPDALPSYAPSVAPEMQLQAPAWQGLQLRAPTMPTSTQVAPQAAQQAKKPGFFERDFAGVKVWQAMLLGAGALAIGVGVYKVATR